MSRYSSRPAPYPTSTVQSHSAPVIILYDVPSHTPQPWAPNIWRIRFILNYKRLRYRTTWVQFPDVESTLISLSAPPSSFRSDGRPVYTLPVLIDPLHQKILSNTSLIADYLEQAYPARPIFPEGSRAMQTLFVNYIQEVFAKPLLPIMIPLSHQRLTERSQAHFRGGNSSSSSRSGTPGSATSQPLTYGNHSQQHVLEGSQREQAWSLIKEQFDFLASILEKNAGPDGDGVVAMGRELTYADFALCSVLMWVRKMAAYDGWSRIKDWNGGRWSRLWDRCREYMDEF